jgi:hypothetical protein
VVWLQWGLQVMVWLQCNNVYLSLVTNWLGDMSPSRKVEMVCSLT